MDLPSTEYDEVVNNIYREIAAAQAEEDDEMMLDNFKIKGNTSDNHEMGFDNNLPAESATVTSASSQTLSYSLDRLGTPQSVTSKISPIITQSAKFYETADVENASSVFDQHQNTFIFAATNEEPTGYTSSGDSRIFSNSIVHKLFKSLDSKTDPTNNSMASENYTKSAGTPIHVKRPRRHRYPAGPRPSGVNDIWKKPGMGPDPRGDVFDITPLAPMTSNRRRYFLPKELKICPPSPVLSNMQLRYPKENASLDEKLGCLFLNSLMRTELMKDRNITQCLREIQHFNRRRYRVPCDHEIWLHQNSMPIKKPSWEGGCEDILSAYNLKELHQIPNLHALEFGIAAFREGTHDRRSNDIWIHYNVQPCLRVTAVDGSVLKHPFKESEWSFESTRLNVYWNSSFENRDLYVWSVILEELRTQVKTCFDGYGALRDEEESALVGKMLEHSKRKPPYLRSKEFMNMVEEL
ncbi:hypothetical protein BJ878DRAFT_296099 [Calycina marina]|uniref:Uncharacterized protein n=1 Tax=Calycina marina TaxID=1763456 RepID=A0A9P8CBA3_9HELO|nr:hypothetical protein BJ878DRAFT_296099 [Calycina marina]